MRLPSGIYAITPDWADTRRLLEAVDAVLAAGVGTLQYRNKLADARLRNEQALALRALCRRYQVPLIINDHLQLALDISADGLHLGADDGNVAEARRQLGAGKLLGVSCYNQLPLAEAAVAAGANYVAFGAVYPSSTKPGAVQAPLALFGQARELGMDAVAIGGISLTRLPELQAAGAHAAALISALFEAADPAGATRSMVQSWLAAVGQLTPPR